MVASAIQISAGETALTIPASLSDSETKAGWILPKVGQAPTVTPRQEEGKTFLRIISPDKPAYEHVGAFPGAEGWSGWGPFKTATKKEYPDALSPEHIWERVSFSSGWETVLALDFPVKYEWERVEVTLPIRVRSLTTIGDQPASVEFKARLDDANGSHAGGQNLSTLDQAKEAWEERTFNIRIDPRAKRCKLMLGVINGKAEIDVGTAEIQVAKTRAPRAEPAPEFTVRDGLPNFTKKCKAGESVKIAYFGGSITAQPGWRVLSLKWFQKQYPDAKIDEIEAAIGGTGSDLGAFRVGHDVIRHKPDLIFIEFAVNDSGRDEDDILASMEGIVRQIWKANANTDICFVYTIMHGHGHPMLDDLAAGRYPAAASTMEKLADHYGIPSIHMGVKVQQMVTEGKVVFTSSASYEKRRADMEKGICHFSGDSVHPYTNTGHILYMEAIERGMKKILPTGEPGAHALKAPLREDNWENAKMIPFGEAAQLIGEWNILPPEHPFAEKHADRFPKIWNTSVPGSKATVTFKGALIGTFELVGPKSGRVKITCDGKVLNTPGDLCKYARFQTAALNHTQGRLRDFTLNENLDADQIHTVTWELLPLTFTQKKVMLDEEGQLDRKFSKLSEEELASHFEGSNLYIGMLMLRGELVDR